MRNLFGISQEKAERIQDDLAFLAENGKQGEYHFYEEGDELGVCEECGQVYHKSVGEANISRSGHCYRHGYNP